MPTSESVKPEELHFEILNDRHDLSHFDCSLNDEMGLDEFIHDEALAFQRENLGITYLFFYNNAIVGFATLAMSQIEIKDTKVRLPIKTTIRDYPAVMIGRLATSNEFRDRSVGQNICLWCVSKAKQLSKEIGCKLIITLTNDAKARFYEKCGFDIVPKSEKSPRKWMYLTIP